MRALVCFVLGLFVLISFVDAAACLESDRPFLEKGMSMAEVVEQWGGPDEKEEFETKREELWRYEDAVVVFHGGKLVSWKAKPGTKLHRMLNPPDVSEPQNNSKPEGYEVEEILTEIMKESP